MNAGPVHLRRLGWIACAAMSSLHLVACTHVYFVTPWPCNNAVVLTIEIRPTAWHTCWALAQATFAVIMGVLLLFYTVSAYLLTALHCHALFMTLWLLAATHEWAQ